MATWQELARTDYRNLAIAFHHVLVEFGYTKLSVASVELAIQNWLVNKPAQTVIERFVYKWLEEE